MSFDPAGFSEVADWLRERAGVAGGASEACHRAAIGRYYYAALLSARDFLARSEVMPVDQSERTHQWVIGKLRESADGESQRLTSELNTMRVLRNRADYGDDVPDLAGEASRMAGRCRRALGYVATLTRRYVR